MGVQIRFTTMKGFEEFPTCEILVKDHYKDGAEIWANWFGCSIHIDDCELNKYIHKPIKRYAMVAMTDEMSDAMIACFGTDRIYADTLETIKEKILKMVEYMNYISPYFKKYEVVM